MKPIASAHFKPSHSSCGETWKRNTSWVNQAASHFPASAVTVSVPATISAAVPFNRTDTSTNMPTLMRKKGMNKELPMNSIRFIKAEECGMDWFNASPATNAPMMGSRPENSAKKAAKNTTNNTKM